MSHNRQKSTQPHAVWHLNSWAATAAHCSRLPLQLTTIVLLVWEYMGNVYYYHHVYMYDGMIAVLEWLKYNMPICCNWWKQSNITHLKDMIVSQSIKKWKILKNELIFFILHKVVMSHDLSFVLPVCAVDKYFNCVCVLITQIMTGDGEMVVCVTGQTSYFYNIEASALSCIKTRT